MIRRIAAIIALTLASPAYAGSNLPLVIQNGQTKQLPVGTTLIVQPATTAGSSVNVPNGTAPTSPVDGDTWNNGGDLHFAPKSVDITLATKGVDIAGMPPSPRFPFQFYSVRQPSNIGDYNALSAAGANWIWSSGFIPPGGMYTLNYAPAYRLYNPIPNWSGTLIEWLYTNHPDWVMYLNDRTTIAWEFGNTDYPPVDIGNPAASAYLAQSIVSAGGGTKGFSLDNVVVQNNFLMAGHYSGTVAPCVSGSRPACGGSWTQDYGGVNKPDAAWTADNLSHIQRVASYAHANANTLVVNISQNGGDGFVATALSADGIVVENVPTRADGLSQAPNYYNGFIIDDLFLIHLYNARNVNPKIMYAPISYLNGHDTSGITTDEANYVMGWNLLTVQNGPQYFSAAAQGSLLVPAYPENMGGYFYKATTATTNSVTNPTVLTAIGSITGAAPGLKVTGANIPPNTYIASTTTTTITLNNAVTGSAVGQAITLEGFFEPNIGTPTSPVPSVALTSSGVTTAVTSSDCGYFGTTDNGVCSRTFTYGIVYVNPVCNYTGSACAVPSKSITIPAASGSAVWYDPTCTQVAAGAYTLNATKALILVRGSSASCPWPRP
jgi:hypothetical protein